MRRKWLLEALDFAFGDLPKDRPRAEVFHYDRQREYQRLVDFLTIGLQTGENILLVGRRGTGKTTLLRRLQEDRKAETLDYFVKNLDLREIPMAASLEESLRGVVLWLNRRLRDYLGELGITLPAEQDCMCDYNVLCDAVKRAGKHDKPGASKRLLLVIDDIDLCRTRFPWTRN